MKQRERHGKGNSIRRITAILLAVLLTLPMQGMSIAAETVSGNRTETQAAGEEAAGEMPESLQEEAGTPETEPEAAETEPQTEEAADAPSNPVHHCTKKNDGSDYTDWSYVYFGAYPQSEVTDQTTRTAIDSAIAAGGLTSNGEGIDVWVGDTRYRRISRDDCNNTDYFDENDRNVIYRYFKWERIKWRVLQNNGSTLFVVADKGLDCKDYNDEDTSITWENCTLRSWLNGTFYQNAFSGAERGAIVTQTVVDAYNPEHGTGTSNNVYLLSLDEIINPDYGFCDSFNCCSASRWMQASAFARARGTHTCSDKYTGGNANCWWWLRSINFISALSGNYDGRVNRIGNYAYSDYGAAVPTLHINLSSSLWSMADEGTSGEDSGGGSTGKNDGNQSTVTAPAKAKISSAKNTKSKKAVIKFKKVSGADGYEISYSTDKKFKKSVKKKNTTKTSYTLKSLKKGKTYYVRVRAYRVNSAGGKVYGAYSKVKKVKIKK